MFWDILLYILIFLLGIGLGFFIAYRVLKKQMKEMETDPKQIQALAKSMGINLNQKQLNMVTRQMQATNKKNVKKRNKPKKKKR